MVTNAELAKSVDTLTNELEEMRKSLSMFNELYEKMKEDQATLAKNNKELTRANHELTMRVAELEQYSRNNNLEIKGVPSTQGECCTAILKQIGEKVGCAVTDSDIDVVHRVPAKEGPHIIARFCSRAKKTEFAAKAKKARLTAGTIGFTTVNDNLKPIYINDHLTPENKRLFAQALALKREKQWEFLWTANGRILARKCKDSRVHRISGVNDLSVFT